MTSSIGARYVKTSEIKEAAERQELAVLAALGIDWRPGCGHIDCPYRDHGGRSDWRWDEGKRRAFCTCIGKRPNERRSHSIFDVVVMKEGIDFETAKVRVAEIIGRSDLIKTKGNGERHRATDANSLLSVSPDDRDDSLLGTIEEARELLVRVFDDHVTSVAIHAEAAAAYKAALKEWRSRQAA